MMKKTLACILSLALSISSIAVNVVSAEETAPSTVEKHYSERYYNDENAQIGGTLNDFIVTSVANPQTTTISQQYNGTVYFSDLNVKTVYEIGEELELSDGRAYAGGKTDDGVNWDIFAQPLESDFFTCDTSEFDNTKPGEYTITVYCKTHPNAKPATFTVTVVGETTTAVGEVYEPTVTTTISQQNNGTVYFSDLNVKTVYEIGEELELSDGRAYAGGKTADGVNWDIFAQPLESNFFTCDTSEFDNTKPGEYTITVYCKTHPNAKPATFTVTVVGETTTAVGEVYEPTVTTTMSQQNNGTVYFSNLNVKTVYEIGEELDLSDGRAYAGGKTADGVNWDIFAQPLESDFFTCDTSEFDNTTPGKYTITVYCKTHPTAKPATFTVTVVGETTTAETVQTKSGDANCDNSVDISDVTLIKCYMLNSERYGISKQGLLNADVNKNGNGVNSNDIIMIQQFALGIIKTFNK